jgi:hypothetical protein
MVRCSPLRVRIVLSKFARMLLRAMQSKPSALTAGSSSKRSNQSLPTTSCRFQPVSLRKKSFAKVRTPWASIPICDQRDALERLAKPLALGRFPSGPHRLLVQLEDTVTIRGVDPVAPEALSAKEADAG